MITVVDELADKDVAPVVVEFFRGVAAAVVIAEAVLVVSIRWLFRATTNTS